MDAAMLGAVGTIVVGIVAAAAAWAGQRGASRAAQGGHVMSGYDTLVNNLQEERDRLQTRLAESEAALAAAYAELARERSDQAALHRQITVLQDRIADLHRQITALGGQPT